jgi:cyclase
MTRFRSSSIAIMAALAALAATTTPAVAQRDFSTVEIKTQKVAGNIYMLEGAGGNIGVSAGEDGILIVDDQFKPLADKIRAALKGINPGKLRYVLNTHFHGDHVGSNEIFGAEATIIAHDNVRKRISTRQESSRGVVEALAKEGWPVITFDASVSVHFNGEAIRVIHVPNGHTDGDSIIHFTGANVVHMGDQMFAGRFPFIDLEGGGTLRGYTKNIADIIAQLPADVKIIPGHGPLSTLDDLKAMHKMLVGTADIVQKKIKEGKSLEAIIAEGLPEYESWNWQFISTKTWIETLHKELSK